jgi:hypothetical protein
MHIPNYTIPVLLGSQIAPNFCFIWYDKLLLCSSYVHILETFPNRIFRAMGAHIAMIF